MLTPALNDISSSPFDAAHRLQPSTPVPRWMACRSCALSQSPNLQCDRTTQPRRAFRPQTCLARSGPDHAARREERLHHLKGADKPTTLHVIPSIVRKHDAISGTRCRTNRPQKRNGPQARAQGIEDVGGRYRVRTYGPCRVKAVLYR